VAAYKEKYGEEAFRDQSKSKGQSEKKRKHEMGTGVNGSEDAMRAGVNASVDAVANHATNSFNEQVSNTEAMYQSVEGSDYPGISSFNLQSNVNASNNNFNWQLGAASLPNYAADFVNNIMLQSVASQASNNSHHQYSINPDMINSNPNVSTTAAALPPNYAETKNHCNISPGINNNVAHPAASIPNDAAGFIRNSMLQSVQSNTQYDVNAYVNHNASAAASHPNYAAGFINNAMLQSAGNQSNDNYHNSTNGGNTHPAASLQFYTNEYIRKKLMELQHQGHGISEPTEMSSQLGTAQVGFDQGIESWNQSERVSGYLPNDRLETLTLMGNNGGNTCSGDASYKTFDGSEE
jgi:hypothetical protein